VKTVSDKVVRHSLA